MCSTGVKLNLTLELGVELNSGIAALKGTWVELSSGGVGLISRGVVLNYRGVLLNSKGVDPNLHGFELGRSGTYGVDLNSGELGYGEYWRVGC